MQRLVALILSVMSILGSSIVAAEDELPPALPEPLDLSQALQILASEGSPQLQQAYAQQLRQTAKQQSTAALHQWQLSVQSRLAYLQPPEVLSAMGREDHAIILKASKPLYDFGVQTQKLVAGELAVQAAQMDIIMQGQQQSIRLMEYFFNVLLADLQYVRDNEAMAGGFTRWDRARQRQQLGQRSELQVLEAEAEYQNIRLARNRSENLQRLSRSQLANALNRTGRLPSRLLPPELKISQKASTDFDTLWAQAREHNPAIKKIQLQLQALQHEIKAEKNRRWPQIEIQAEAGWYQRDIGANNAWRSALNLNVPLGQWGDHHARVQELLAQQAHLQAQLIQTQQQVYQQLLQAHLQLQSLQVQQKRDEVYSQYREYYLDRARSVYELEVQSDLGDAMVQITDASLRAARTGFDMLLLQARIVALCSEQTEVYQP